MQFSTDERKCEKLCTKKISFEPLSKRRHRFDLIETYKFVNNKYKTDPQSLFSLPYRMLRGHKDNVFKPSARTDIQKQFVSHRFVDSWNLLSSKIIESDTVDSFHRRLMRVVPSGEDDYYRASNQVSI